MLCKCYIIASYNYLDHCTRFTLFLKFSISESVKLIFKDLTLLLFKNLENEFYPYKILNLFILLFLTFLKLYTKNIDLIK